MTKKPFYAPALAEGVLRFTLVRLYVRTSQNWFPFSNFSLPQPNVMKLAHNAYYHKTQIKYKFWWRHFYHSRAMPLYHRKVAEFFVSVL